MDRGIHLDSRTEPPFWYVIDRAIAHRSGVVICGPPPYEVFADVSRQALLGAMIDSMRWHREHEEEALHAVLNAGRAWRFAVEDTLGFQVGGRRMGARTVGQHRGHRFSGGHAIWRPAAIETSEVNRLLDHVEKHARKRT
jgi:hypothetical protein